MTTTSSRPPGLRSPAYGGGSDNAAKAGLRKLIAVDPVVVADFALHPLGATETDDVCELVVERRRTGATVTHPGFLGGSTAWKG